MTRITTPSVRHRAAFRPPVARPLPAVARIWRMLRVGAWLAVFAAFAVTLAPMSPLALRSRFLKRWARGMLRALGVRLECNCTISPCRGPALLIANHVSSIDPLLVGAIAPACFVAKSQLAAAPWLRWPLAAVGTIFIDRSRRDGALHALAQMYEAFDADETVAVFPEATVVTENAPCHFNSALLEPATEGVPTYLIALSLERVDGMPCPEADFPLNKSFATSIWRLARVPGIVARVAVLGPFDYTGALRRRVACVARETIRNALFTASFHRPVSRDCP